MTDGSARAKTHQVAACDGAIRLHSRSHPEVMKKLGLEPGQVVDGEMMKRILDANALALGPERND